MRRALPTFALFAIASALHANPTGGDVAAGSATIAGQGSSTVTVDQTTHTAVINWQTFSIGSGELTKFVQPSSTSATLNRVLGGQTSFLNGTLSANGQVFLINGNGVVVGANGVITTAGFTASTRDIANSDFMSGNLHFVGGSDGGVQNLGTITALGGNVVLIGKTVDNQGTINATGTAGLVAGDDVLLAQKNDDGSTITVNPVSAPSAATGKVGVHNSGTIAASSAELKAANGNIYALAIQNEGIVRATTVTQQGGHIFLTADSGTVVNSGTLDASATAAKGKGGSILVKSTKGKVVHSGKLIARGGASGVGGNAEVSGPQMEFTGTVDLTAPGGTTGNLLLDPATLNVVSGGGGSVSGGQNSSTGSTIDPTVVDNALESADLILNADTNITISNALTWTSGDTLTLSTNTSGSTIKINAPITATSGGLTINAAGASDVVSTSAAGAISLANFSLLRGSWVQLVADGSNSGNLLPTTVNNVTTNATLPGFAVSNNFNINSTNGTFLRADGGNGGNVYYGLEDVYGLQGMQGFLTSNFTLNGRTIDAGSSLHWHGGLGFVPIGSETTPYQGSLSNGAINNLSINQDTGNNNVGLIGVAGANANISNIQVENSTISGGMNVGSVVGENFGTVDFCYVFGGALSGDSNVGGVVGLNTANATVEYGYSDGNVTGNNSVGGAVGENDGLVYSVQGYGSVNGVEEVGGLVGYNTSTGTINLSNFSGSVGGSESGVGTFDIGGIAGENDGTVTFSNTYPGATVSGNFDVGGLVGLNTGTISNSYNSATVTGTTASGNDDQTLTSSNIGGIAGENESTGGGENTDSFSSELVNQPQFNVSPGLIETSYNAGSVDGDSAVGGIAGTNDSSGTITTCYNVGSIGDSDASFVGGIVGDNYGFVTHTYSSGLVQGQEGTAAGIIGFDEDFAETDNSYWDTTTSGQAFATNSNINNEDASTATENNLASVDSATAYTIANNDTDAGTGYGFFGTATAVAGTDGVYQISASLEDGAAWYIIEGQTRPMLAMELNANINNPHQLQLMAVNLNQQYFVTNSLDMSVTTNPAEVWNSAGFDPVGADPAQEGNFAFNGNLNGNGEDIRNLFINRPETDDVGLFGYVGSGSTITNVSMYDSNITGNNNVGGIAGDNAGTINFSSNNFGEGNEESPAIVGNGNNVGGIAGLNETSGVVTEDTNAGVVKGNEESSAIGGLVGDNLGNVNQSINDGTVGSGVETNVGGLVGENAGTVANSYNDASGFVNGFISLGGLVGLNDESGVLETSYAVELPADVEGNGAVVGTNNGTVRHVYWVNDNAPTMAGIAVNNDTEDTNDVRGFSHAQLTDMANFAQGPSPELWDFSPQNGDGGGIWGVNVYNSGGQINGGLPVLQWQYPVNTEIAVVGGTQNYGYQPTVQESGEGVSQLPTYLPNGPTFQVTGGNQAGDTQTIVVNGNPIFGGYNIEYVNGTVNLVPAPLDIVANSFVIPLGQMTPTFTATYNGLQNGDMPTDLDGTLVFTVSPLPPTAAGQHTITVGGQSSSNYDITYFTGILNVTTSNPTPDQIASTFTAEIASLQNQFGNDPFNGIDPLFFMTIPNEVVLGGDLVGAINDKQDRRDYAHASGTSHLPAFSRLITPGSGVVEIIDGVVVIGDPSTGKPVFLNSPGSPLSQGALTGLRGVLSPSVYNELLALIHAQ